MAGVTRPKVDSISPRELVDLTLAGRIRVPSFQRSYRWDRRDVTELFNSIFRGYPIGNLLVWQRPAPAEQVTLGHLHVQAPKTSDAFMVVDGQQRITSLVSALTATPETVDPRFRIFFDLSSGKFTSGTRNQQPASDWLPIYIVLDTRATNNWIRARPELTEAQIELADQLVAAVRDYKIPIYIVTGNDDQGLRDIFDRMNTFGKPLTSAEVFNALHSAPNEEDPSDLHTLRRRVQAFGFGDFSESVLMQSLLAIRDPVVDRDFRDEFSSATDRHEAFVATETAIGQVVDFLRDEAGIPHVKLVPYTLYIPVLSRFVSIFGPPKGHAAELLRRWIWRGAVLGVAPQGNTIGLRRGASAVKANATSSADRLLQLLPAPQFKNWSPDLSQVALNRAQAKVNILGLLSRRPMIIAASDTSFHKTVDVIGMLDSGYALIHITDNLTKLGRGVANRLVHPAVRGHNLELAIQGAANPAVLHSHCIDQESATLFRAGKIDQFLSRRADATTAVIANHVQERALFGFRDGPDLTELFNDPLDDAHAE